MQVKYMSSSFHCKSFNSQEKQYDTWRLFYGFRYSRQYLIWSFFKKKQQQNSPVNSFLNAPVQMTSPQKFGEQVNSSTRIQTDHNQRYLFPMSKIMGWITLEINRVWHWMRAHTHQRTHLARLTPELSVPGEVEGNLGALDIQQPGASIKLNICLESATQVDDLRASLEQNKGPLACAGVGPLPCGPTQKLGQPHGGAQTNCPPCALTEEEGDKCSLLQSLLCLPACLPDIDAALAAQAAQDWAVSHFGIQLVPTDITCLSDHTK